jgi:hypothetical protein
VSVVVEVWRVVTLSKSKSRPFGKCGIGVRDGGCGGMNIVVVVFIVVVGELFVVVDEVAVDVDVWIFSILAVDVSASFSAFIVFKVVTLETPEPSPISQRQSSSSTSHLLLDVDVGILVVFILGLGT